MASHRMAALPSVRRQNLLAEFASLKSMPPAGVYVCLNPDDPSSWSGVLFVRKGPYASAILRFQLSFPPSYPSFPPLATFTTNIFHPLVTPLTTYTYTTGSSERDTVSARDEERLPPGGFSLTHGFPKWFGRSQRMPNPSATSSRYPSGSNPPTRSAGQGSAPRRQLSLLREPGEARAAPAPAPASPSISRNSSRRSSVSPDSPRSLTAGPAHFSRQPEMPNTREVLCYIRSTFDDACVLDSIPLEAAGNPGAWHAWRTHRQKVKAELALHGLYPSELDSDEEGQGKPEEGDQAELASVSDAPTTGYSSLAGGTYASMGNSKPRGEWSWDGVWEARVRQGVALSTADPTIFGGHGGGGDELIHFLNMDRDAIETVKENIKRSVEMGSVLA